MTIIVLVKQVPDMNAVKIDAATGVARTSGKAMSSFDSYAVQHALVLREKMGGEIVAVSAGPATAKDALTRALAMGADRGLHIELGDQEMRDSLDMANVFFQAVKVLEPSIVICGQLSDDLETGQIGPQLAELLDMPHVSWVVSVDVDGERLKLQRDTEAGYQTVTAPMPVVLMATQGFEEPPYPSIKGMMAAKRKPVEKVAAVEKTGTVRIAWGEPRAPLRESGGILVQGASAQDAAKQLVDWMKDNKLISS
jgi:electron transfer flavoprotein beta subunit